MAEINTVPGFLENFELFLEGTRNLGIVDIDLSTIIPKKIDLEGAGIGGTMSMPAQGQTDNIDVGLNFRTTTTETMALAAPKAHVLEAYGAVQYWDSANGKYEPKQLRVAMRGMPSEVKLGKLASASTMENSVTLNLTYLKVSVNGVKQIEIDKFNYIHYVNGNDYLAPIKSMLGL